MDQLHKTDHSQFFRYTVRVPFEAHFKLKKQAKKRGVSEAEFVQQCLDAGLAEFGIAAQGAAPTSKSRHAEVRIGDVHVTKMQASFYRGCVRLAEGLFVFRASLAELAAQSDYTEKTLHAPLAAFQKNGLLKIRNLGNQGVKGGHSVREITFLTEAREAQELARSDDA